MSKIARIQEALVHSGIQGLIHLAANSMAKRSLRNLNHRDKIITFYDKGNNKKILVILLAGLKPRLWPTVFERINHFLNINADVVIVDPGGIGKDTLINYAKTYGWSYLATKHRRISTALNIAVRTFNHATLIFKLDDDVFVTKNAFKALIQTLIKSFEKAKNLPAIVMPVMNLNLVTYIHFLEVMGLTYEFKQKFKVKNLRYGLKIVREKSDVAIWIWKNSLPLDDVARIYNEKAKLKYPNAFDVINVRPSIGFVLFTRTFWNIMREFLGDVGKGMGYDDLGIVTTVSDKYLGIVICLNVLVGHLSYGPQTLEMIKFYERNKDLFQIRE